MYKNARKIIFYTEVYRVQVGVYREKDLMVYVIVTGKSVNQVVVNYLVPLGVRVQSSHLQFD